MRIKSRQRGVSLIEVMVAIVIFSIGALGIALMELKGIQFTKQSGIRTVAIQQATSLADAMRANPLGVYGQPNTSSITANGNLAGSYYLYDGTTLPSCAASNYPCQQALTDIQNWLAQLKAGTVGPQGSSPVRSSIVPDPTTGTLAIITTWNGAVPDINGAAATDESYKFDYQP